MAFREEEGGAAGLDLDEHIKAVEEAARDWGVHADALEGRFVSALLAAIAESGRMNRAAVGEVERVLAQAKAVGDQEVGRLKIIFSGGEKAIAIAKQAAETAIAAAHRGEVEFNRSVAQIAEELSTRILDSSQKWLVLKQRCRNRRDAWLLALCVTVVAVGVLIAGYELRGYQDDPAVTAYYETQERIAECQREPVQVKDMRIGALRPACWLDQVLASRGGG
jgi:hypothetical protein